MLAIALTSYLLLRAAPGDPTRSSIFDDGGGAGQGLSADKGALAQNKSMREKLHLDEPAALGFLYWIGDIVLRGDLGTSAAVDKGRPVVSLIMEKLPVTVTLNFWAILITYLLAVPIGIFSAVYPESRADKAMSLWLFLLYSLPVFWVALLLQVTFCAGGWLPLFPLKGIAPENTWGAGTWEIFWQTARHYALPVLCLSYAGLAGLSRFARAGMIEVINQDYIRTARAKGASEFSVIFKHALRNGMITLLTLFGELLPGLVGGSIIVEYVFSIPGMGSLSMTALSSRDIPLLMALFTFGGALTLGGMLISDLLYAAADPRINFAAKK